jgi:hypothetical protein
MLRLVGFCSAPTPEAKAESFAEHRIKCLDNSDKCMEKTGRKNIKVYSRATTVRVTFGDAPFTLKSLCELCWLSLLKVRPL